MGIVRGKVQTDDEQFQALTRILSNIHTSMVSLNERIGVLEGGVIYNRVYESIRDSAKEIWEDLRILEGNKEDTNET